MAAANAIFSAVVHALDDNSARGSMKMHVCEAVINELDNHGWTSQNDSIIEFQGDDWIVAAFQRAGHVMEETDDSPEKSADGGSESAKPTARSGRGGARSVAKP